MGDELFVVQARPITVLRLSIRGRDPWNDSRAGDFLWTNTNVGEAIPDVMTPATWSMVQVFLSDAMATASVPPYIGYGRIGGRIYLNVSVMKSLSGAVGVGEKRFRYLTEEVFGQLPDGPGDPAGAGAALGGAARDRCRWPCTCWARPAGISGCWMTTWATIRSAATGAGPRSPP